MIRRKCSLCEKRIPYRPHQKWFCDECEKEIQEENTPKKNRKENAFWETKQAEKTYWGYPKYHHIFTHKQPNIHEYDLTNEDQRKKYNKEVYKWKKGHKQILVEGHVWKYFLQTKEERTKEILARHKKNIIGRRTKNKKNLPQIQQSWKEILEENKFEYKQVSKDYIRINCVFHEDKNPSLVLYTNTGGFKCYGCGKTGNKRTFKAHIQQQRNIL